MGDGVVTGNLTQGLILCNQWKKIQHGSQRESYRTLTNKWCLDYLFEERDSRVLLAAGYRWHKHGHG